MSLRAIGTKILVEIEQVQNKTAGGIFLPDGREDAIDRIGRVLSVGERVESVKTGDRVLYKQYQQKIQHEGKTIRICDEQNILAVLGEGDVQVENKFPQPLNVQEVPIADDED